MRGAHLGTPCPWHWSVPELHRTPTAPDIHVQKATFSSFFAKQSFKNADCTPHAPCHKPSSSSKGGFDLQAGFPTIIHYRNLSSKASGNCHCWRQVLSEKYWGWTHLAIPVFLTVCGCPRCVQTVHYLQIMDRGKGFGRDLNPASFMSAGFCCSFTTVPMASFCFSFPWGFWTVVSYNMSSVYWNGNWM